MKMIKEKKDVNACELFMNVLIIFYSLIAFSMRNMKSDLNTIFIGGCLWVRAIVN